MPNEPSALKTLRKFYGDRLHVDPEAEQEKEYQTANDRSVIISLAAIVDSALEFQLALAMPVLETADEETFLRAFRAEGPMGGFAYKTELCFYMGLIDERLRQQIDELRSVRNAVAHAHRIVSFSHKPLQNAVKRLFAPRGLFSLQSENPEDYRKTFIAEVSMLQPIINRGRDAAVAELRERYAAAGMQSPV